MGSRRIAGLTYNTIRVLPTACGSFPDFTAMKPSALLGGSRVFLYREGMEMTSANVHVCIGMWKEGCEWWMKI